MSSPKNISVAVATYNRAQIIPETLGHILGQTFPPSEIVIVDDGSTDGTREAVEAISKDIVYVRNENAGPGAALKRAIELCSNEWIALCDDDDRWRPEHLARRVKLLNKYPEADYTFSNFTSFGPDARVDYNAFSDIPPDWLDGFPHPDDEGFQLLGRDLLGTFLKLNPVFPTSTCFSRELYEKCGGIDPKFSRLGCWDAHFTWRLVLHGNTACDHNITVETRRHAGSFSRLKSRVYVQRSEMIQTSWKDGWIPDKYFPQITQSILDSIIEASWWAWHEKDHQFLREISRKTSITDFPLPLKLRILYSRLIAPRIK
jgi:glycosyltransferase involved in cell wall biosynthesis